MKSKAKPAKGSARTKRFDRGGTVAALAGLGTLAYLLNKKKSAQGAMDTSEGPEFKRQGEYPAAKEAAERSDISGGNVTNTQGGGGRAGTIIPEPGRKLSVESETPRERQVNIEGQREPQTRVQTAPQSTETVKGVDEKTLDRLQRRDVPSGGKKKSAPAKKSSADDVIAAGQRYARIGERDKPYPSDAQRAETKEKARLKDLSKRGFVTPGEDKDRKDTSKGRSANPIQGTIDQRGKSMARTPQQKMSEGAREVQRRREEAEKSRYKKGGMVKKYASGGSVSSASKRADGIAMRGKTRGKIC